jgi:hypothetical protein
MVVDWPVHLWRSPADKAVWSVDVTLLVNDRLRITHDLYSHASTDHLCEVGPVGERFVAVDVGVVEPGKFCLNAFFGPY